MVDFMVNAEIKKFTTSSFLSSKNDFNFISMEVKEPALSYNRKNWTIEEYLQMEEASVEKHEYYQGEVFAMSGTKLPHVIICKNLMVGWDKN
jgi:hypothetical protein